ncbi:uncharacterized protein LOC121048760 [Rosa chinensis]|uniref:uncharacterized protein LOC121048760 n=1 Tax=Rosa chinensis TaxID=74649 RepID=UPI001AD8D05C|nr:uncharacterized protein LOC121048760 [Rosa chinensis]
MNAKNTPTETTGESRFLGTISASSIRNLHPRSISTKNGKSFFSPKIAAPIAPKLLTLESVSPSSLKDKVYRIFCREKRKLAGRKVHGDMHILDIAVDLPSVTEIFRSKYSTTLLCTRLRCQVYSSVDWVCWD